MVMSKRILALAGLLVGCQAKPASLHDLPCGNDPCADGYVCHPELKMCVPQLAVGCAAAGQACAATTNTGDACPSPTSFLPCDGNASSCAAGCRTCLANHTWSACHVLVGSTITYSSSLAASPQFNAVTVGSIPGLPSDQQPRSQHYILHPYIR